MLDIRKRTLILALGLAAVVIPLVSCGDIINLPIPAISTISPTSVPAAGTQFTLIVNGSGFAPSSLILLNGAPQVTIFDKFGQNELSAAINPVNPLQAQFNTPGTIDVTVFSPQPGGGTSNIVYLTVTTTAPPIPIITSIIPNSVLAGGSGPTITVIGSNFVYTSVVTVNGNNRQMNGSSSGDYVNGTEVRASLNSTDLATAGPLQVAVVNPPAVGLNPPGGGTSNVLVLNVVNPVPIITSVSPSVYVAGVITGSLGVQGSGFDGASQVLINGSGRPTTFIGSQLVAALSSGDLAAAGTYTVQVVNPTPGGGASGTLPFSVIPSSTGLGLPELVDVATDGVQANDGATAPPNSGPAMDPSGRFVIFVSSSTNLLQTTLINPPPNPLTNSEPNIFLRDTCLGQATGCVPRTILVNVGPGGSIANGNNTQPVLANGPSSEPAVDLNGTEVTYTSLATDLVSGINFDGVTPQVFVANPCAGVGSSSACTQTTGLISVATDGVTPGNSGSGGPSISSEGRFIAFASTATNLVSSATTGAQEIFLRDTCLGVSVTACKPTTYLVSTPDGTTPAAGASSQPAVVSTKTGQFVVFTSAATNLGGGSGGAQEVYRTGFCIGISKGCTSSAATLISTPDGTTFADGASGEPAMTSDGRFVAFASTATDLGTSSNGTQEIYLRDTCQGVATGCKPATSLISVATDGVSPANALSESPSLGSTGQFVAYASLATNLTATPTNGFENIYVRNTCIQGLNGCAPSTAISSVSAIHAAGNGASLAPVINGPGHVVVFYSAASNLVLNDLNAYPDIFLGITTF
ncbi:MAG TPA: hypothetical protein VGR81_10390 [Candidatus Acidoferrales bacterium]|nr:hypothetical protein [Candidatus Acidoferrales bacterium]